MACNKYLTHNSIDKTKEVLYPWIPLNKPKGGNGQCQRPCTKFLFNLDLK